MAGLWDDLCEGFFTTNGQSLVGLDFLGRFCQALDFSKSNLAQVVVEGVSGFFFGGGKHQRWASLVASSSSWWLNHPFEKYDRQIGS